MDSSARKLNSASDEIFIYDINQLPSLPAVVLKIQDRINDPMSNHSEIASLLITDQSLSARVLRLVNSSYYGVPGGVTDVKKALSYLGFNTLAQVVLSAGVISVFHAPDVEGFSAKSFWRHSFSVAIGAEFFLKNLGKPGAAEAFTGGLLHDIGKLVLHEISKGRFEAAITEAKLKEKTFLDGEISVGLPGHPRLGEEIATRWGLPKSVVEVISNHHLNIGDPAFQASKNKDVLASVILSNILARKHQFGNSGNFGNHLAAKPWFEFLAGAGADFPSFEKKYISEIERLGGMANACG